MKKLLALLVFAMTAPHTALGLDVDIEATFLWLYHLMDTLSQIIIFVAILLLFWGLLRLLLSGGNEELKEASVHNIRNSITVIAATIGIWLILTFFMKYFNFEAVSPLADIVFKM